MTEPPTGWALTTVGEAMSVAYGKSLERGQRTDDGEYQYVGSGGRIAATDERLTFGETIVVGRKGTAGSVQRFPQGCWPSDTTFFIEVPDGLNAALIEHQLRSAQLAQHDRSTALPGLGRPDLEATSVVVPPLAEQERIVTAIEEAFSKLDAGEAGLRTVRQLLKRMRDAILTAAVTGRLVPQDPTDTPAAKLLADLGAESIAEPEGEVVPDGWAWALLGSVSAIGGGIQKQPKRNPVRNRAPFLRVANVGRGKLDLSDVHEIEVFDGELDRHGLVAGDLLVVEGNGSPDQIGRSALWHGTIAPCVHQNHLIRVRTGLALEPSYLELYWNSPAAAQRVQSVASSTSGLHTLSTGKLRILPVVVPPLEEQKRIVTEVERQLSFVEACERALDVGLARAAGLRRSVLKAAFEGRLVPQDPSDEPATVMLERIRAERAAQPVAKRWARQSA